MNRQTSHIVLSKSVLQNIRIHIQIESLLNQVYNAIVREAQGSKKSYKFDLKQIRLTPTTGYNQYEDPEPFIITFMDSLQKEFPGCKIERVKTVGYENKIVENFIVIDWA